MKILTVEIVNFILYSNLSITDGVKIVLVKTSQFKMRLLMLMPVYILIYAFNGIQHFAPQSKTNH